MRSANELPKRRDVASLHHVDGVSLLSYPSETPGGHQHQTSIGQVSRKELSKAHGLRLPPSLDLLGYSLALASGSRGSTTGRQLGPMLRVRMTSRGVASVCCGVPHSEMRLRLHESYTLCGWMCVKATFRILCFLGVEGAR